jgi:hypothetical protein
MLSQIALASEAEAYHTGAEDGFWRGYEAGANACRRYIMGETTVNPSAPEGFGPLGARYYPHDFSSPEDS